MLTHAQIWTALDRLAASAGLSPSGLAKKAGLDPTTFNKSKRVAPDGRQRWPSTESVAKALAATATTLDEFLHLMDENARAPIRNTIPLIGLTQADKSGYFDDAGFPSGPDWEEIQFPAVSDERAYALEVSGTAMLPIYPEGAILLVSPAASVRRGDRVVLKTQAIEVLVGELKRRTAKTIEVRALTPDHAERTLAVRDILWMARIVWASQ